MYARAGYLHPVFTPSGAMVTGDYCTSHRHQHGVFTAWTRTRFEGREVDFWNAADQQGMVELTGFVAETDEASFVAALAHVDLTAPGGPRTALEETWQVRAYALADATVIDLESQQSALTSPLMVLEYHYGGFGVRGPEAWEGAGGAQAITSEGFGRADGNQTTARWVALSGAVADAAGAGADRASGAGAGGGSGAGIATIAVLASPHNPRAPEPVRIHPTNPYFCFAACQQGTFMIEAGAPRLTRYRVVAMDGPPDIARLNELWQEFADAVPNLLP